MKELKYLNICFDSKISDNQVNDYFSSIPNVLKYETEDELLQLVEQNKINLLVANYNFETFKKVRQKDDNLQFFALFDELKKEYLVQSLQLKHIKFLQDLTSHLTLKDSLKECIKNLDSKQSNIIELKNHFTFDTYNKILFYKNDVMSLSKKERLFLNLLLENVNRALSYDEINDKVWEGSMTQDALRSIVKELRKKVYKELIKNVSGVGYRLDLI